jgi:hypothetical protein
LSDACFSEYVGTSLTENTCETFGNLQLGSPCSASTGVCSCQVSNSLNNTATSYSVAGNSLTEVGADPFIGATVDYCVNDNSMVQQRRLPPDNTLYVIKYTRQ